MIFRRAFKYEQQKIRKISLKFKYKNKSYYLEAYQNKQYKLEKII